MTRRAGFVVASALGLALWCGVAARAAESLLAIVPSDALAVGVVKNLTDADAKLQKLAELVQAPALDPLDALKAQLGIAKGLDEKGSLALIVLPGEDGAEPILVVVVPVTDYKEFIGQFEGAKPDEQITEIEMAHRKSVAAHRGSYALLAPAKNRKSLEQALNAKASVAGELAGIESWLAGRDAAFIATRAGVCWGVAKARTEYKKFQEEQKRHRESWAQHFPGRDYPGDVPPAMLQFYEQALALADKEISLAAVGAKVDAEGTVCLTSQVRFAQYSLIGGFLAGIKPADGDLAAGLPGGPFVFAAAGAAPESLMKPLVALASGLMQKGFSSFGLTPAQAEQLVKTSLRTMGQIQGMSIVMQTGKSGDPIYSNIFGTLRAANAPQYLEDYGKMMEAQSRILKEAKDSTMKPPETKKTEIGGRPALEAEMTIPLPKANPNNPMLQPMMQAMIGADSKMKFTLAAANQTTVVFGYGTTPEKVGEAIALVRSAKPGLAGDKDVAATTAFMPAGAQWVAYVSPAGFVGLELRMMEQMMAGMGGRGFSAPAIPAFPETPPVGMAVKATGGGLEVTVVVPAALLKAGGEYYATMRNRF